MTHTLFTCAAGSIVLPSPAIVMVDREDGGNLLVNPPRDVWERSELTPRELTGWAFLVAAAGWAMLQALPQLEGGCINYWEAGNWALNDAAEPRGPKRAADHRRMHLHLLGRSRFATSPNWQWGEAPKFSDYKDGAWWAKDHRRLTPDECVAVLRAMETRLTGYYGLTLSNDASWTRCARCGYPTPSASLGAASNCEECS